MELVKEKKEESVPEEEIEISSLLNLIYASNKAIGEGIKALLLQNKEILEKVRIMDERVKKLEATWK